MKKHCLLGILFCIFTLLFGCANTSSSFTQQTHVRKDLLRETWLRQVNTNPNQWTQKADYWFLTGEPNRVERYDMHGRFNQAMTIMSVRVPDFTNIQVDGKFQVQIMGQQENNSVYVVGPNEQTRQTVIEVRGKTLCIHPAKDSKVSTNKVIIRIGIRTLNELTSHGPCLIAGRDITGNCIVINSTSSGNILLSGNMNLMKINQTGSGTITVIGANSPTLNVNVKGNGCVNVSGRVGIHYINHAGNGTVSIVGADSDGLVIDASGGGKTTVAGYVNLKKVTACNSSCVFLYWVNSNSTYVYASDQAHVGLAGNTNNLNVDLTRSARFDGQYLHGNNVYVRTRDSSHANVCIGQKMFASAGDNSSIYFYGSPNVVSRYTTGLGTIIPVWNDAPLSGTTMPAPRLQGPAVATYAVPVRHASFKDEYNYHVQESHDDREKDGVYYRVKRTHTSTNKLSTNKPATSKPATNKQINEMNFHFQPKAQANE